MTEKGIAYLVIIAGLSLSIIAFSGEEWGLLTGGLIMLSMGVAMRFLVDIIGDE